ncbi:MAG TPA: glycosyl hydrolase [Solirubrobacterales bacterium]|nr:glycosyl hydrolase [Solirubrobacterales bacterium]
MQTRRPTRARFLAVFAALLAIALSVPAVAGAAIKLGVYSSAQGQVGAPEDAKWLDSYAQMVGRKPDIVMDYSNITDPLLTSTEITNLAQRGETPLVTWQLYKSGWGGETIPLQSVANGSYDSYLRKAAEAAQAMPFNEILIRFAHEMNGNWYGWSGNPTAYVEAWRHVVSVFRSVGTTNVKFVWSPNVDNGSYPFAAYFPGDSWVDYVGVDGYNWGTTGTGVNKWQSLYEVFASSYAQLTQMSTKPVMITETSSSETGGEKGPWILNGLLHTVPEKFPRIAAVIWFDRNQEDDWRIASSNASLEAYRRVVANSLYGGTDPAPAPEATEPIEVTSVEVTPKPKHGKKKAAARVLRRRARVVYRLSRRAPVSILVHAHRRNGSRHLYEMTVEKPKRHGSVRLTRLLGGHPLGRGTYRVVVTALDESSGTTSRPRKARFKVTSPRS